MSLRQIPAISAFVYTAIFLTSRAGTVIHEVLGHALAAVLAGGRVTGLSIRLFGTGACNYVLPEADLPGRMAPALSGIGANLLTGFLALALMKRPSLSWERRMILCVFAVVSLGSQLTYLVMGTYYGHGDPSIFHEALGPGRRFVWILSLAAVAPVAYVLAGRLLGLQNEIFPGLSLGLRTLVFLATFGVAAAAYGLCFHAENASAGFLGGMEASERMISLHPFPIIIPLVGIGLISGAAAFCKTRRSCPPSRQVRFRIASLAWSFSIAIFVGAIIVAV